MTEVEDRKQEPSATTRDDPFVTIVIPVHNDAERLRRALAALRQQTYPSNQFEVIVADNGSRSCPSPIVDQYSNARLIVEAEGGSYAARNAALQIARGVIIGFTDADCLPQDDWIERAVAKLTRQPGCAALAGKIAICYGEPDRPKTVEIYEALTAFPQEKYVKNDHFGVTANLFVRRSVIDKIGPFDQHALSGGDLEWGNRLWRAGYHLAYAEDVVVHHPARRTFKELRTKAARVSRGVERLRRAGLLTRRSRHLDLWSLRPRIRMAGRILLNRQLGPLSTRFCASGLALLFPYFTFWLKVQYQLLTDEGLARG